MFAKNHSNETKQKISKKLKGNRNLGGRIGKTFSSFKFYKDNIFIYEVKGQIDAKLFCKENEISFQTLCKKTNRWKNWYCDRNLKNKKCDNI